MSASVVAPLTLTVTVEAQPTATPALAPSMNPSITVGTSPVRGTQGEFIAWMVLNIWPSHIGLPILIAAIFLSKKVKRHPTLINLCCTWILVGVSSSLLLYTGKAFKSEPSPTLCLIQATLLAGVPAYTSVAVFLLVLQMCTSLTRGMRQGNQVYRETKLYVWLMVVPPWIVFITSAGVALILGYNNPSTVSRNPRFFYCSIDSSALARTVTVFAATFLGLTLILGSWTTAKLYARWRNLKRSGMKLGTLEIQLAVRITVFGKLVIIMLGLDIFGIQGTVSLIPDLIMACLGSIIVLIFGSQPDILRAVFLCGKDNGGQKTRLPDDEEKALPTGL